MVTTVEINLCDAVTADALGSDHYLKDYANLEHVYTKPGTKGVYVVVDMDLYGASVTTIFSPRDARELIKRLKKELRNASG